MAKRVSLKGKGADLFFGDDGADSTASIAVDPTPATVFDDPTTVAPELHTDPAAPGKPPAATSARRAAARPASSPAIQPASSGASKHASTLAYVPYSPDPAVIEQIRKTVKVPGKEVSFVRLTADEKGDLADIVYTYKRQGLKTSENEINRIAVNYMLADFHANGERSLLAQVLAALRA